MYMDTGVGHGWISLDSHTQIPNHRRVGHGCTSSDIPE